MYMEQLGLEKCKNEQEQYSDFIYFFLGCEREIWVLMEHKSGYIGDVQGSINLSENEHLRVKRRKKDRDIFFFNHRPV